MAQSPMMVSPSQLQSYEIDDDEKISPFSKGIRQCMFLHDFEMPEIGNYARQGDRDDYLLNYNANMDIAEATPVLKCNVFFLTLEESALRWYKKLPPGNIHS
ncbi:hypothetical protein Fot_38750 [Forsythia ovata]|uniref:Retrotransposon gag domain-containing protein n=1 Tax=Forsythia ovata TaxID=205694 RepID=A0ABD1S554_9LAMI